MFDFWDILNSADLGTKARNLLSSLDATDPRVLIVPIVLLVYLGSKMVSGQPNLRRLGLRLGAAAFLIYGGYCLYEVGSFDSKALPGIALRSANAGGLVLAVTWTLLPIVTFVYAHLRLALAAFIGYTGYALLSAEEFRADQLPEIALRGLIAVGLVLLVAWILHPIWDFFKDLLPRPRNNEDLEDSRSARRGKRRRGLDTRKVEPEPTVLAAPAPATVSLPPPPQPEDQRRRDRARLQMEMAYVLALPLIGDRFPRPAFDSFVERYLGDHLRPEDVEENCRQLQQILQEHQRQAQEQLPAHSASRETLISLVCTEEIVEPNRLAAGAEAGFQESSNRTPREGSVK